MPLAPITPSDIDALRAFLGEVDLTLAGLEGPGVRLWVERDPDGSIVGSTGLELSADGRHALIRSVAVAPDRRTAGAGSRLAHFALDAAREAGAEHAWLFSRRSGPFWQKLGFVSADRDRLASVLSGSHQVELFRSTGQLAGEVAWSMALDQRVDVMASA
ncbi:GNAT family N-acetyltransferase [Rathayibacter sp. CAU 1779]